MNTIGTHIILDLWHVPEDILNNKSKIKKILLNAAKEANATIIHNFFHKFRPIGISGVVVIAESHISIHTFPESGYAGIDIYTCGDKTLPEKAMKYIIKEFKVKKKDCFIDCKKIVRGFKKVNRGE